MQGHHQELPEKCRLYGWDGSAWVKIHSLSNALDVHQADIHIEPLNVHAIYDKSNTDTLNQNASIGDSTIEVNTSSQYTANDYITIVEGTTQESDILKVIASDGTDPGTLTLDRPLENAYTTAATVISGVDKNLKTTAGTIAAPITYSIAPPSDESWHIRTLSLIFVDGTNPAIELFSGIAALTNGLVIRQNGTTKKNLAVIRSNQDMYEYFGGPEVDIQQKSGGGDYMLSALWHLTEHAEAIVKLVGSSGDSLDFVIQDDLTAITEIEVVAFGHKEG
jgi:hypothetical protein